jgi:hypothetical protein
MEKPNEEIRILMALNRDNTEKIREIQKEINQIKGKMDAIFTKVYDKKEE